MSIGSCGRTQRGSTDEFFKDVIHTVAVTPDHLAGKVDVLELIQRIEARGSPAAANRSLAYISKFFNWCA